jgi:(S)-ureidoglycine aminohydrolase
MTLRMEPFGQTRTHVSFDHALIGPDSHVSSPLANWQSTSGVILISPAMGAFPKSPGFVQYIANITDQSISTGASPRVQRLIYVLDGSMRLNQTVLTQDMFAWLPPDSSYELHGRETGRLLVFEKVYSPIDGQPVPAMLTGSLHDIQAEPFMGDSSAMLSTLLPVHAGFDMAVNVFTYESGATLPFVETHVMEHGLYMRAGQGIYRLSNAWYPVQKGDSIWMAAYCPQWFVAMGKESASYIYYKDIHRDPLLGNAMCRSTGA